MRLSGATKTLRTKFALYDNQPIQQIVPQVNLPVEAVDLSGLPASNRDGDAQRLAAEEALRPFDLTQTPLLRAMLLRMVPEEHVLLLTMHHIVSDAWSASVFLEEFGALYTAYSKGDPSPLPELSLQYADYAAWQRNWLQGEALEARLGFWRRQLSGAPPVLHLRSDRPRPQVQTFEGGHIPVMLPRELHERSQSPGSPGGRHSIYDTARSLSGAAGMAHGGETNRSRDRRGKSSHTRYRIHRLGFSSTSCP